MSFFEQLKKDKEQFKKLDSFSSRFNFIVDYYKTPILIIVVCIAILISVISGIVKNSNTALSIITVNSCSETLDDDSFFYRLLNEEIDKDKIEVTNSLTLGIENNESEDVETIQVLNAVFLLGECDVFMADDETFETFVGNNVFMDLSEIIGESGKNKLTLHTDIDSSGNQIIDGIVLDTNSLLHKAGYYEEEVTVGICANCKNLDNATKLILALCG